MAPDRFVDRHQARFAGTIELRPDDADAFDMDSEVVAVVVLRVAGVSDDGNAKGDVIRTNKVKIRQFAVVDDPTLQVQLRQALNLDEGDPALPFDGPPEPLALTPSPADGPTLEEVGEPIDEPTGAERYLEGRLSDPEYHEAFTRARHVPPGSSLPPGVGTPGGAQPANRDPVLAAFLSEEVVGG